mgnify:CR=1 FL=1
MPKLVNDNIVDPLLDIVDVVDQLMDADAICWGEAPQLLPKFLDAVKRLRSAHEAAEGSGVNH